MILIDYSAIGISNITREFYRANSETTDGDPTGMSLDLCRHMVYNSIRSHNVKFKEKYGKIVICCDDKDYWRKDEFPNYKAGRKKAQDKSGVDWPMVFQFLDTIKADIRANFPYKVVQVAKAEADDIIGVLSRAATYSLAEPVMIVSGDEDFKQLLGENVQQYSPVQKKFIECTDPEMALKELTIRGDAGDGVPNVFSPDNCFVDKIRQKPIYQKKLDVWLQMWVEDFLKDPDVLQACPDIIKNWQRNRKLVDLIDHIPEEIQFGVLEEFNKPIEGDKQKLFNHMLNNNMRHMIEHVAEF